MNLPGKNILILGAVCLSIVGATGAYKAAQAAREKAQIEENSLVASVDNANKTSNKLLNALQQAELESIKTNSTNPFAPAQNDTMTDRLSKSFFNSYIQAQAGKDTGLDDASLVNNALATVDVSKLPREKYAASELKVIAGNTSDELKAYANEFAKIQIEELIKIQQNQDFYKNNLNEIGKVYALIGERLVKMQVPVAVAAEHLVIVNAYILMNDDFKLISDQEKDPLKALLGLRQYKEATERQGNMFIKIAAYLKSSGILFDETEPGYFWVGYQTNDQ